MALEKESANLEINMDAQTRKDQVLKAIVEEFIKTAEPVGSVTIMNNYGFDCSSATIRNTMVQLEKEGLIEKTHVSSGRVPSAKGYQYYLDHLTDDELIHSIDMEFQRDFKDALSSKTKSVEEVISASCEMLSELTNTATMVLGPKADEETLVSIQLIQLDASSCLGIFITSSGYVEKKTFVINGDVVTFDAASSAVKILNERLKGTRISEREEKAKVLAPIMVESFGSSGEFIMRALFEALVSFASKRYKVYGKTKLLSLPEFSDDSQAFIQAIDALENPDRLEKGLTRQDDLGDFHVGFTSGKNGDLAVISKEISSSHDRIAVVGPKRMDYQQIISALEYVAYMIDKYFRSDDDSSQALIPVSSEEEAPKEEKKHTAARKKKKEAENGTE